MGKVTIEIYSFAKQYLDNYDKLKDGDVITDDSGSVHIQKMKTFPSINTPTRVNIQTGVVDVNSASFGKYDYDVKMFFLLWALLKDKTGERESYLKVDIKALQLMHKNGFRKYKTILPVVMGIFMKNGEFNRDRISAIRIFIDKYEGQ